LNVQYPGYPMNANSALDIAVGDGLQSEQTVAASVADGVINVKQFIITSVWEIENYFAEVYPNPSVSFMHIEFGDSSPSRRIELFDLNGRKLVSQHAPLINETVDINTLSQGHYILNVHDKGKLVKTMQVIVK
jgi:hypothetical protein